MLHVIEEIFALLLAVLSFFIYRKKTQHKKENVSNVWLVDKEHRMETPNKYCTEYKKHLIKPVEAVIVHGTATGSTVAALNWLTNEDAQASAHFIIGKDGTVWQLASLDDRCWHAGGRTSKLFEQGNVNGRTIGIELVNWVKLDWDDKVGSWKTWTGKTFRGFALADGEDGGVIPDVEDASVGWAIYPKEQLDACRKIIHQIGLYHHQIKDDWEERVLGHCDVDPTRKVDPSPRGVFPFASILPKNGP